LYAEEGELGGTYIGKGFDKGLGTGEIFGTTFVGVAGSLGALADGVSHKGDS
jgi:hypothetical protein